jgi:hypothetical protein
LEDQLVADPLSHAAWDRSKLDLGQFCLDIAPYGGGTVHGPETSAAFTSGDCRADNQRRRNRAQEGAAAEAV